MATIIISTDVGAGLGVHIQYREGMVDVHKHIQGIKICLREVTSFYILNIKIWYNIVLLITLLVTANDALIIINSSRKCICFEAFYSSV